MTVLWKEPLSFGFLLWTGFDRLRVVMTDVAFRGRDGPTILGGAVGVIGCLWRRAAVRVITMPS